MRFRQINSLGNIILSKSEMKSSLKVIKKKTTNTLKVPILVWAALETLINRIANKLKEYNFRYKKKNMS